MKDVVLVDMNYILGGVQGRNRKGEKCNERCLEDMTLKSM